MRRGKYTYIYIVLVKRVGHHAVNHAVAHLDDPETAAAKIACTRDPGPPDPARGGGTEVNLNRRFA